MTHRQRILVTGGCGFIGAEVVLQLLAADYSVLVVDNFVNSSREVLRRLSFLSGICVADDTSLSFRECDVTDQVGLRALMTEVTPSWRDPGVRNFSILNLSPWFQFQGLISAVIHFAALKAVGDSITMPIAYYKNNVGGSLCLLEVRCQVTWSGSHSPKAVFITVDGRVRSDPLCLFVICHRLRRSFPRFPTLQGNRRVASINVRYCLHNWKFCSQFTSLQESVCIHKARCGDATARNVCFQCKHAGRKPSIL